ncbi:hypothetical protein [Paenibacillus sp. O199]|uniref:hypothetical protein n=1 Tax=Paenibacillus sp. O199 TaxID=1643925 RepID=UPI000AF6FE75|nr:hypothetical protein [Paenibacillus sp. O199]
MFTRKRWSTRLFKTCKSGMIMLLGALLLFITLFPNTARAATSVYTISAFTNTSESNLYIYESQCD